MVMSWLGAHPVYPIYASRPDAYPAYTIYASRPDAYPTYSTEHQNAVNQSAIIRVGRMHTLDTAPDISTDPQHAASSRHV